MKKRAASVLLALCMALTLLPTAAVAADEFDIQDGVLKKYRGESGNVTIPAGVTSIEEDAFSQCDNLTSVTIPASVTNIDSRAIHYCRKLTSIEVEEGNSAYSAWEGVLFNKERTKLVKCPEGKTGAYAIPAGVTSVGAFAFSYCENLTSVAIPAGVTSIERFAFAWCELRSVDFPDSVTSVGDHVFQQCFYLTSVTLPNSLTSIEEGVFDVCTRLTTVTIPAGVTSIGNHAFSSCESLTTVTIPAGVTSIGDFAFSRCESLTTVTIPAGVTSIGKSAFSACKSLPSVTIPDSVTSIGADAFLGCESLTNIVVGEGNGAYSSQDGVLFNKEKTELIQYPGKKAGAYAIPAGVTTIGDHAFQYCSSLTSVTIGNGVTSIGESAFHSCERLTSVTIPDSVTSIGESAFNYCKSLTSVTIPDSVTSIGNSAFNYCTGLTSVAIGNGVTTIGDDAFYNCERLTSVTIPIGVTSIGSRAFYNCERLTSVTIPSSVTKIGGEAFRSCGRLTSVTLPASLRVMGDNAFNSCSNLYSVILEEGATVIGSGAFYACKNLTEVQIPDTVTRIGDMPFSGCPWFLSGEGEWEIVSGYLLRYRGTDSVVTIPEGVVSIDAAFAGNENITEVTLPDTVTRIGWASFQSCPNLKRINVPASVQRIDYDTYYDSFYKSPNIVIHCPPGSYADTRLPKTAVYTVVADLPWTAPKSAYAATQSVLVDGEKVGFQMYALKDQSGNPTNYVKLRDVASVLNGTAVQFNVGWDGAVNIETGKAYAPNGSEMSTPFSGDRVYETPANQTRVNGLSVDLDAIVLTDNQGGQYTYYKLRDLGAALGFTVDWSAERGIFIETK